VLDKLIETTDDGVQTKRMRKILLGIGTLMTAFFVGGLIISIFSTNLAMGSPSIELSSLIAPAIPENKPPEPEPESNSDKSKPRATSDRTIRVVNMQRTDESPAKPPQKISTTANKYRARPRGDFDLRPDGADSDGPSPIGTRNGATKAGSSGGGFGSQPDERVIDKPKDEVKKVAPPPEIKKTPDIIRSIGVVNGKAINLVKPVVTSSVQMAGARGSVRVNVLINEAGRVASANAVSGHPLLRRLAADAALRSTFSPTLLNNKPVKVRGVIIYNFS